MNTNEPIVLGGHFGSGVNVFSSAFHLTLEYGRVKNHSIEKPEFQIKDIGKEDAIELATLLLVTAKEI